MRARGTGPRWTLRRRAGERGQSLVEFTLILPVFLLVLLGMLEYGSAYDHRTAMAYAVREGARVGASLGNGGASLGRRPRISASIVVRADGCRRAC